MPKSLACDGSNVYVADLAAGRIRRISLLPIASPVTSTLGGAAGMGFTNGTSASSRFDMPTGLALDGTALYVADKNNNAIRSIDLSTGVTTTVVGKPWLPQNLDAGTAMGVNGAFFNPTGLFYNGDAMLVTTPVSVRVMY
jgi:DNA-binding beta-propeller fold protein YncE